MSSVKIIAENEICCYVTLYTLLSQDISAKIPLPQAIWNEF